MTQEVRRKGRDETEEERADRMWSDLIQEVRVAQTGVQILFGFLLTVVFTPKYDGLAHTDQVIYIVTVILGASATGALIGPVSLHRLVTGRRVKPRAVRLASRLTFVGLLLLLATMTAALLLILRVATHDGFVAWLVAPVVAWYLLCWFGLPLWVRRRHTSR
jgi:MFS family permease